MQVTSREEDEVTESSAALSRRWRYGMHPRAAGLQVRSMGRVDLPIGEALRLELLNPDAAGEDVVHIQYYIVTEFGGWALWASCPSGDLADLDATVHTTIPAVPGEPQAG
jgi:hypothetical protein